MNKNENKFEENANLSVGYLDGDLFESEGLTKFRDEKIAHIKFVAGWTDVEIITPEEAVELIKTNKAFHLIEKMGLEAKSTDEELKISKSTHPRVYEVEVSTG